MQTASQGHSKAFQIVGVGSLRGDDGIGLVIAQAIEQRLRASETESRQRMPALVSDQLPEQSTGMTAHTPFQDADQQVRQNAYPKNIRIDLATSPIRLLDLMPDADTLVICDAWLAAGAAIGTIRKWVWPNIDIQNTRFTGSHDLSLGAALLLGDRLGVLPRHVLIWGIAVAPELPASHCQHHPPIAASIAGHQQAIDIHQETPWREYLSRKLFESVPSIVDRIMSDICEP